MRVLLLCEYASLNGGERSMLATLPGLAERGIEPIVACPIVGPLAEAVRALGLSTAAFNTLDLDGCRLPLPQLREQLADLLRRIEPDVLHANSLAMGRLAGPVARELHQPSMAHLRDIVRLGPQAVADLNCHDRLLAVSEATRQFHVGQGLAPQRVEVLHNGVDLERFRPRPPSGYLHRELELPEARPLVATIGQICLRKGHDVLLRAIERLPEATDALFLIVGERYSGKDESRSFEAALLGAAEGRLRDRLRLIGPREDVDRLLNELTLLVHPARQEPLGRVLLEAAAAGVPIIATDVGGTREIFPAESEAARLVPPDDPAALARVIAELLGDEAERARLGEAARRRAIEAFDHHRATAALAGHYEFLRTRKRD